jgi:hypothetical protein
MAAVRDATAALAEESECTGFLTAHLISIKSLSVLQPYAGIAIGSTPLCIRRDGIHEEWE